MLNSKIVKTCFFFQKVPSLLRLEMSIPAAAKVELQQVLFLRLCAVTQNPYIDTKMKQWLRRTAVMHWNIGWVSRIEMSWVGCVEHWIWQFTSVVSKAWSTQHLAALNKWYWGCIGLPFCRKCKKMQHQPQRLREEHCADMSKWASQRKWTGLASQCLRASLLTITISSPKSP